jgi:hypothetical protein
MSNELLVLDASGAAPGLGGDFHSELKTTSKNRCSSIACKPLPACQLAYLRG